MAFSEGIFEMISFREQTLIFKSREVDEILAICSLLICLRFFHFTANNRVLGQLTRTLATAAPEMAVFFFSGGVCIVAFGFAFFLAFGADLR